MTAIPSPRWVARELGLLIAGQTSSLTNEQKRALAFTVETLTAEKLTDDAFQVECYLQNEIGPGVSLREMERQRDTAWTARAGVEAELDKALRRATKAEVERGEAERQLAEVRSINEQYEEALEFEKEAVEAMRAKLATLEPGALGLGIPLAKPRGQHLAPLVPGKAAVGTEHPGTSHEAAAQAGTIVKNERLRIMASVIEDGPASASVIAARLGLVPNQCSARCNALRAEKWLEWRGVVPPRSDDEADWVTDQTPSGRSGNVLFLTDDGRDELIREHGSLEVAAKLFREGRTS